jgi:4-amino-4-deoxy-L-arabinose transferase-like glycosyltransferase
MKASLRRDMLLLLAVSGLALLVRLYQLDALPPGLHHDEALNGLNAQLLLKTGERPIYLGSKFNGEPLLEYSLMLSETLFGMTPFAVRLPSALYGALTIPAMFLLTRTLFQLGRWPVGGQSTSGPALGTALARLPGRGLKPRRTLGEVGQGHQQRGRLETARLPSSASRNALAASFILSTLYWHINASREGYKPIFLPLFGALGFWLLLRSLAPAPGTRPRVQVVTHLAAGVVLGLAFYTYPSIRFLYPVVALFCLFVMLRERVNAGTYFRRALVIAAVALLVFAPLGLYFLQHPAAFFTRSDQVSVWATRPGHAVEAVAENTLKVAGMFFVAGDTNPRQNLPGRPAFDGLLAAGFLLGLALALWRWKQPVYFLLLLWLFAMVLPSIVTEAAPNFLRSLGATVPAVLLIVVGYDFVLGMVAARAQPALEGGRFLKLLGDVRIWSVGFGVTLLWSAALSLNAYFNELPRDPRAWFAFDVGLVKIADSVRRLPADEPVYLTPIGADQATIQFMLGAPRPDFNSFYGRRCVVMPPPERTASMLVVSEDFRTLDLLQTHWPQGRITGQVADFAGKNYLTVYQVPAQPGTLVPRSPLQGVFGGQAALVGYTLLADRVESGQGVPLVLFWRAQQPILKEYTVFTHLLGGDNPRTHTPLWGQRDSPPCSGGYPTTRWGPGETMAEDFLIVVDKDAPAGLYQIEVGLYELDGGARLTLPNGADHLLLGPVEIFRK